MCHSQSTMSLHLFVLQQTNKSLCVNLTQSHVYISVKAKHIFYPKHTHTHTIQGLIHVREIQSITVTAVVKLDLCQHQDIGQ